MTPELQGLLLSLMIAAGSVGADYAARTTAAAVAALRAAGVRYVVRYVCGDPSNPKTATAGEIAYLHRNGFAVLLVFERSETRPLGGAAAGRVDGLLAAADVKALGYPFLEVALLVAFDTDVKASNRSACVAYWFAFAAAYRSVLGAGALVGEYGDYDMIDALGEYSDLHWQPNAWSWSAIWRPSRWFKRTHPLAHVLQRSTVRVPGLAYDPNDALRPFAAWYPHPSTTQPEDPDMARHYKTDDGDMAEWAISGGVATWIRNGQHREQLIMGKALEELPGHKPRTCSRAYLRNFLIAGPAPSYPPGYTGPMTTAASFGGTV